MVLPAVCLMACSETLLEDTDGSGGKVQDTVSFVATLDGYTGQPKTRTQVGGVGQDGSLYLEWSVGDSIGVFGAGGTVNAVFYSDNTQPSSTAGFSGPMNGDTPRYAYYPYAEGVTDLTAIPVHIPSGQMYTDEMSVARYDVKAASIESAPAGGYSVRFRQMAALVRFEIDLTGVNELADDELLMNIHIRPTQPGVPMTGDFTYDLTNQAAGLQPGEDTTDGLTISFTYPPTAREAIVAYAMVAPGAHENEEWTCEFTTDRQSGTFTTTALCDFEAGKYYTVPLSASMLADKKVDYEKVPEEETANCYIITAPGDYDFKATVIGNGAKGIIPGAGFHTETPYINPKSAGLLWAETRNSITNVRLVNGRVHYTANSSSSNAVIAVYSDFDCKGEILWSWHIWGTNGVPEDEEYTNQAGQKFMVMDRDLGAYRTYEGGAMLYQWGRKDPFPPVSTTQYWTGGSEMVKISTKKWPTVKIDNATIQDGVQHPMEMISSATTGTYNWLGKTNFYLWGDAGRELPDSLYEEAAGAGWNQQKTIYDPSPVGYRVANIFTFSGFTDCASGTNEDIENRRYNYVNYKRFGNGAWYFLKNSEDVTGSPYSNSNEARDGSTGKEKTGNGYGGWWWSAEAYTGDDGRAYACYLKTDQYLSGGTKYNVIQTYGRSFYLRDAYAIRCVREEESSKHHE